MNESTQKDRSYFREKQHLLTWKGWLVTGCIVIMGAYYWTINKDPFVKSLLILIAIIVFVVVLLMQVIRLSIRINTSGIGLRTGWPLLRKEIIYWNEISKIDIVSMHPSGSLAGLDKHLTETAVFWICQGAHIAIIERKMQKPVVISVRNVVSFQFAVNKFLKEK